MPKELIELGDAMKEKLEAQKGITRADARYRKAHYRWLMAKDAVRAMESELLNDFELSFSK